MRTAFRDMAVNMRVTFSDPRGLSTIRDFKVVFEAPVSPIPVILDLDSNGIQLISVNKSTVKIDIDADGVGDTVGRVSSGDGILAVHR